MNVLCVSFVYCIYDTVILLCTYVNVLNKIPTYLPVSVLPAGSLVCSPEVVGAEVYTYRESPGMGEVSEAVSEWTCHIQHDPLPVGMVLTWPVAVLWAAPRHPVQQS